MKMKLITLLMAVATLGGCAIFDNRPPEEAVVERAEKRLELLMVGKVEDSYAYTSPGYRSTHSLVQYASDFGGASMWLSTGVEGLECLPVAAPTACEVAVLISYRPPRLSYVQTTELKETWIKVEGNWYLYRE